MTVTPEFPIAPREESELCFNSAVDYVIFCKNIDVNIKQKQIFYVELKTNSNSFNLDQLENMYRQINVRNLIDFVIGNISYPRKNENDIEKCERLRDLVDEHLSYISNTDDMIAQICYICPSNMKEIAINKIVQSRRETLADLREKIKNNPDYISFITFRDVITALEETKYIPVSMFTPFNIELRYRFMQTLEKWDSII